MVSKNNTNHIPEPYIGLLTLGQIQSVHRIKILNRFGSAIIGSILTCGGSLAMVYTILDTFVQVARYGPIMVEYSLFKPILVALILIFFGYLAIINATSNWEKTVKVYEKGLVYSDRKGLQIWLWADVAWFFASITNQYSAIPLFSSHRFTLQKMDGTKLVLDDNFEDIILLGKIINNKVTPYQYRHLRRIVSEGRMIKYGPFEFDKLSFTINKNTYAWKSIENLEIKNGYATIRLKGKTWFNNISTPVSSIPNLDAFCTAINQIVQIKNMD